MKYFDPTKYEEIAGPMRVSIPLEVGGSFEKGVELLTKAIMDLDITMAEGARVNFLALELWRIGIKQGNGGFML